MNSQEVLIAFAKLSHAEKEFAVTESTETSRQYSQHVSSLSSQLAAVRKELFESNCAHDLKNTEINSLKSANRSNQEYIRGCNGRIDQLMRQIEDREQTIVTLARQVNESATDDAGTDTVFNEARPRPEKPTLPPMPGYEWFFSETAWQWNTRPLPAPFGFPPVHPSFNCAGKVVMPLPIWPVPIRETRNDEREQRFEAVRQTLRLKLGANVGTDVYNLLTGTDR